MARDIAIGAEGMAFDSRADQIEHSVVNGSPTLQCFFGAVLPKQQAQSHENGPRHSLHALG